MTRIIYADKTLLLSHIKISRRLKDVLGADIPWLSNRQIEVLLNCSKSTRRRDARGLVKLGLLPEADYYAEGEKRKFPLRYDSKGLDFIYVSNFWEWKQLARHYSRTFAFRNIHTLLNLLEDIENDTGCESDSRDSESAA